MTGKQLGVCVVGPGAIATSHMQAQRKLGLTRNEWVIGASEEHAAAFGREWGFRRAGASLDDALADARVDVVLIATPNQLHAEQAIQALAGGKHVIVEIPVAMNAHDARAVVEAAETALRRAFVCHTFRSWPGVSWLRRATHENNLRISQVVNFASTPRRNNENWIGGTRDWVDDLLWHNACHYVDTALWVLGIPPVTSVSATFGRANPQFGMTMDVSLTFATEAAQIVTTALTFDASERSSRLQFVTDQGLMALHETRLIGGDGREIAPAGIWANLLAQDREMLSSITSGSSSRFDVVSVLPTMEVLGRAQAQAQAADIERPVAVSLNHERYP